MREFMKREKIRRLTKCFDLDLGWKCSGWGDLRVRKSFGLKEKVSKERAVEKWKPNHAAGIYRKTWLNGSRSYRDLSSTKSLQKWICQGAVEDLSMAKIPRCIEKLSRIYRLNIKFLDGLRSYQDKFQKARWIKVALVYPREREREDTHHRQKIKKERVRMHEICMNIWCTKNKVASRVKSHSKPTSTYQQ